MTTNTPMPRSKWPAALALGAVMVGFFVLPASAESGAPQAVSDGHDHSDPTTKNSVSRSAFEDHIVDPTTPARAAAARKAVTAQRAEKDPTLIPTAKPAARRDVPEDRYAMANGCYAIQAASNSKWVSRNAGGFRAAEPSITSAEPFHFQATDLGKYLLYGTADDFLAREPGGPVAKESVVQSKTAGVDGDWTVTKRGAGFQFVLDGAKKSLAVAGNSDLGIGTVASFRLHRTTGCAKWPEVQTNISGQPHKGQSDIQEVRGYLDAHTHGMAFEFLGGKVHCGRPWHPYGVEAALVDCADHTATGGKGALLEAATGGEASHDPVGWPTFKDWPAPNSLTHEGTYYKWMERAWRGGQRLFVNLLVENGVLCKVYPLKQNSCDEMDSVRLQAQRMREFERYVDAQSGGPGEGWYRIVTDPFQAREVINQGKLAVVMGIETSVVFGCTMKADIPQCTKAQIDKQLDEVYGLGVRQMELVNKFDNALSGVAGDSGTTGPPVNGANFLETGSFWAMKKCVGTGEGVHDKEQMAAPSGAPEQDALFGAIVDVVLGPIKTPIYQSAPHCNQRGLTSLGDHTIRRMAAKKMIFDPDHMSVKSRDASLDLLERLKYPGVVSSHSWATPDAYPRIYRLGGVVTPYAGDSTGFVAKWKKHQDWADGRFYFGFGFGADINGLGSQGNPRGANVANPVRYPFKGIGGVTVGKQVSGERVYDINIDGVSHYGLYPDWIEDLRKLAGTRIIDDMARGPEAYLQMWERSLGVSNDACRQPSLLKRDLTIKAIRKGTRVKDLLFKAGQPHSRLGNTFSYCAKKKSGKKTAVKVTFVSGKVSKIS